MKICPECKKEFDNARAIYCCIQCADRAKYKRRYALYGKEYYYKSIGTQSCEHCKKEFAPTRRKQKYCSVECSSDAQKKYLSIPQCLEEASRKLDKKLGYVRVYCPQHPMANTWGYVYEHRLIMEGILGRELLKTEHVHHLNGKRWDNRPENLQVLSASDHGKVKNHIET